MSQVVSDDALDWTRSLVQARLVSEIFSDRVKGFVLKGGMAMKVRYAQSRATQDIDLDSLNDIPLFEMQKLMRNAIERALSDNLLEHVVISEPKQTETTARWRIRGIDKNTHQPLTLTVEVSRRDNVLDHEFNEMPYQYEKVNASVLVYKSEALAFKKVKALLAPSREAPRDISDLFLMIKGQVDPPVAQLKEFLKQSTVEDITGLLWQKIDSMDFKRFKSEVLPSLPATSQAQEWYKSWDDVRLEVGQKVEDWLRLAQQELRQELEEASSASQQDISVPPLTSSTLRQHHGSSSPPVSKPCPTSL